MACAACAANVERKLNAIKGVNSATVSLAGRTVLVDYDPNRISLEDMKRSVSEAGYDLVIEPGRNAEEIASREYTLLKRRTALSWILAILTMGFGMGWFYTSTDTTTARSLNNQMAMITALANMIWCGRNFYISAWRQLLHGTANMDSLVALSTLVAFLFSTFNTFWGESVWGAQGMEWHTYFDSSVMIVTFVLTGRCLEEKAKDSTAASIRRLMGLQAKTALLVSNGETRQVPLSTIEPGDVIEVSAGEKIPVDGTVIQAESFMTAGTVYVDEAMITGEPTPVAKRSGDKITAGTIPSQGKLRMRTTQTGEHTVLAQIIKAVQEAQGSKAPVQRIIDRAARVFVPTVAVIAMATFIIWWVIGGKTAIPHAIISAVSVLVIACPCAMGLATPTALMVGIGKAAEKQILIKDATALERLGKTTAIVTDKTGTLTIPNPNIDFTKTCNTPEERETLKPNATQAIDKLKAEGIEVWLMSGDTDEAVSYWAKKAGISHWQSMAKPDDKQQLVKRLQDQGKRVMMIGDGINDTQALATADVSMAMGRGTDVAIDVAQVTLMGNDLMAIPEAIKLSRKTTGMIWQNLFWAFAYNIVCIPLAAGIPYLIGTNFQITPMWASALMACSSVSVVANSLRLKLIK